ncbi:MAG: hypothetical protein BroJett040_10710 [Oligoflexia bacterium]|nr:MAG: hypothetical protein BroJett040_10710 [Oligoflexia bacterium]
MFWNKISIPTRMARALLILIIFMNLSKTMAFPGLNCRQVAQTYQAGLVSNGSDLTANSIYITGNKDYSHHEILHNLQIESHWIKEQIKRGSSILSVGEGYSDFVPTLKGNGLKIKGLDIWYDRAFLQQSDLPQKIKNHVLKNQNQLITGSAFDLPYPKESIDHILSHKLMNNLHIGESVDFLYSALQTITVSGSLRISDINQKRFETLQKVVLNNYQDRIQYTYKDGLLVVEKMASTKDIQIRNPYDPNIIYSGLPAGARLFQLQH